MSGMKRPLGAGRPSPTPAAKLRADTTDSTESLPTETPEGVT